MSARSKRDFELLAVELVRFSRPSLLNENREQYLLRLMSEFVEEASLEEFVFLLGEVTSIAGATLDHLDTIQPVCADKLLDELERKVQDG